MHIGNVSHIRQSSSIHQLLATVIPCFGLVATLFQRGGERERERERGGEKGREKIVLWAQIWQTERLQTQLFRCP